MASQGKSGASKKSAIQACQQGYTYSSHEWDGRHDCARLSSGEEDRKGNERGVHPLHIQDYTSYNTYNHCSKSIDNAYAKEMAKGKHKSQVQKQFHADPQPSRKYLQSLRPGFWWIWWIWRIWKIILQCKIVSWWSPSSSKFYCEHKNEAIFWFQNKDILSL